MKMKIGIIFGLHPVKMTLQHRIREPITAETGPMQTSFHPAPMSGVLTRLVMILVLRKYGLHQIPPIFHLLFQMMALCLVKQVIY